MQARKSTLTWAEKHFEMDYGRFDRKRHPMVIDILSTLDRRRGCKLMILGCIQSFKTLVATIFTLRCLQVDSMKTGWYSGSKDAVKAWAEEKFNPSFDITLPVQRLLPKDKNKNQKLRKLFAHTSLQLLSANTQLDRQQKSLEMIVCDECWLYETGALGEIENRTASFPDHGIELGVGIGNGLAPVGERPEVGRGQFDLAALAFTTPQDAAPGILAHLGVGLAGLFQLLPLGIYFGPSEALEKTS